MNGYPGTASNRLGRRAFVRSTSGGLAAGYVLQLPALQAAPANEPIEFLVASDTHLGYRDKETAEKQWRAAAKELATLPGDLVLHLGDVVDGGRVKLYATYKEIRDSIGKPVYEIPGNHDPLDEFEKQLGRKLPYAVEHKWLRILLLNNSRLKSHDGFLDDEQLVWLDQQCKQAAEVGQLVVIAMHVPAHKNLHPDRGWYVKPANGQTRLYEILEKHADRVACLLHGHFHNGVRGWHDHGPLYEMACPSVLYNLDRKLEEQQAPGFNLPEFRPGLTAFRLSREGLQIRYKPLGVDFSAKKSLDRKRP